jgi:hypothetical protein
VSGRARNEVTDAIDALWMQKVSRSLDRARRVLDKEQTNIDSLASAIHS